MVKLQLHSMKNHKVGLQLKLRLTVLAEQQKFKSEVSLNSNFINIARYRLANFHVIDKVYNVYNMVHHGQSVNNFNKKPQGGPAAETTTDNTIGTTTVEIASKC